MLHDRRNGDGQGAALVAFIGPSGGIELAQDGLQRPQLATDLREATPNSHGPGILRLPSNPLKLEHHELPATLHSGGVRRLLLDGGPDLTEPSLADNLVDHIVAYLADSGPSSHLLLTGQDPWPRTASTSPASPAFHAMCRSTTRPFR